MFYAYQLAIRKLEGYTAVERLEIGESVYAYRFTVQGKPVYVLWREPGRLYFPDEAEPAPVTVRLPVESPQALVTYAITELGQTEPATEAVAAQGGAVSLSLGSVPVFVEGR